MLCVACGYDLNKGKRLVTQVRTTSDARLSGKIIRLYPAALVVLAMSPGIFLLAIVLGFFQGQMPWLLMLGGWLALTAPLVYLSLDARPYPDKPWARLLFWPAAAIAMIVGIGIAMVQAPKQLLVSDTQPPGITLAHSSQMPNRCTIIGLNVRYPPSIEKADPGLQYRFRVCMSFRGGESSCAPPHTLEDGYGNSIRYREPRAGVLHVEDNLGGFTEVDWNGPTPVLVTSHAFPRTASARGPRPIARDIENAGGLILCFSPLVAWMLLTMALTRLEAFATLVLYWTLGLQFAGLAFDVLACLLLRVLPHTHTDNGGNGMFVMFFVVMPAALMSLAGLSLLSFSLVRSAWTQSD